ncbi:MAG: hypothetical protein ACAI35_27330 [Candidatus Methylacidiphilales bacterium]|nr:hypothetical protein [Candidatus Methylacidiphilales bacterium]
MTRAPYATLVLTDHSVAQGTEALAKRLAVAARTVIYGEKNVAPAP